jgi:hypothetical protein
MKRIIDPYWVSFALIVIGLLMIMYAAGESHRVDRVVGNILAAHSLAGGMIVSSGIISLAILKVFGRDNDEKK